MKINVLQDLKKVRQKLAEAEEKVELIRAAEGKAIGAAPVQGL